MCLEVIEDSVCVCARNNRLVHKGDHEVCELVRCCVRVSLMSVTDV